MCVDGDHTSHCHQSDAAETDLDVTMETWIKEQEGAVSHHLLPSASSAGCSSRLLLRVVAVGCLPIVPAGSWQFVRMPAVDSPSEGSLKK